MRKRLDVDVAAKRLATFLEASAHPMQVMARACGHDRLSKFREGDLTSWKRDMAELSGVKFGGVAGGG